MNNQIVSGCSNCCNQYKEKNFIEKCEAGCKKDSQCRHNCDILISSGGAI